MVVMDLCRRHGRLPRVNVYVEECRTCLCRTVTSATPSSTQLSEIDHRVEVLIRARLDKHFPDHDIIGEEVAASTGRRSK